IWWHSAEIDGSTRRIHQGDSGEPDESGADGGGLIMNSESNVPTPIYLDNNATTQVDPVVVDAMLPFFTEQFGNPSSLHNFGNKVGSALKKARQSVQNLLGAEHESEIIFTSCGTESDSTAILSALRAQPERKEIITTTVEHPAVLNLCDHLASEGYTVHKLEVDSKGRL